MKPETEKALRSRTPEQMAEIVRLMIECLDADQFAAAMYQGEGEEKRAVFDVLIKQYPEGYEDYGPSIADDLHEAICEGRQQDAIDLLQELTGEEFRTLEAQSNLFPSRATKKAASVLLDW